MATPAKKNKINDFNVNSTSKKFQNLAWLNLQLSKPILNALSVIGFDKPTRIQQEVIPFALQGFDILGAAETGSGKTHAFAIPILDRWLNLKDKNNNQLFAIVVTPTRELALQIEKEISRLAKLLNEHGLRSMCLFGGLSQQKQVRLLKRKPHIVVATPGRLWTLMNQGQGNLDDVSNLKVLVIDEIDRMLEKGHFQELDHIVARIHASVNSSFENEEKSTSLFQTLIFSATLTFTHSPVMRRDGSFSNKQTKFMKVNNIIDLMRLRESCHIVDLTQISAMPVTLIEQRMHCEDLKKKDANLYYLLQRHKVRTLIFTNSIDAARRVFNLLRTLKYQPSPCILHAKMPEKSRLKNLEKFTTTENSVLIATDVAARGLDIAGVLNVIHYQVPKTSEVYVHRSGRTARASKDGHSILFVDPVDVQFYKRIRKNLNWKIDLDLYHIDSTKLYDTCLYRTNLASELESVEFNLKKITSRNQWFKQLADEADIILDDDLIDNNTENGADESLKIIEMRKKLKKLNKALNLALKC